MEAERRGREEMGARQCAADDKRKIDGSSDVLLAPRVKAVHPSWSPAGRQIAFSGRAAGTFVKFKLWLVFPEGGHAAPHPRGIESGYDTIWSGRRKDNSAVSYFGKVEMSY